MSPPLNPANLSKCQMTDPSNPTCQLTPGIIKLAVITRPFSLKEIAGKSVHLLLLGGFPDNR